MIQRSGYAMSKPLGEIGLGLISGATTALILVTFAALMFAGGLSDYLSLVIVLVLVGHAVFAAVVALTSAYPVHIVSPHGKAGAILGPIGIAIGGGVASGSAAVPDLALSFLVVIVGSSLLTALFLYGVGALRLGRLMQYVPYPVIGGFFAGAGYLLLDAFFIVVTGHRMGFDTLGTLLSVEVMMRWLPAVAIGLVMYFIIEKLRNPLGLAGTMVVATLLFHAVVFAAGIDLDAVSAGGWLFGPLQDQSPEAGVLTLADATVDWKIVGAYWGDMVSVAVLTLLSSLLALAAVGIGTRRDVDLDRELQGLGIANALAAPLACLASHTAGGATVLCHKVGATSRWLALISAGVCVGAALGASAAVPYIPRMVLGGVFLLLALGHLVDWLWEARNRLSRLEYGCVILIVVAVATMGFLEALLLGLVLSLLIFAVRYSRVDPLRDQSTGLTYRSPVERSDSENEILAQYGASLLVFRLHGFLFFGTGSALADRVFQAVEDSDGMAHYVLLDFRDVSGIDSSAAYGFARIMRLLTVQRIVLLISGLDEEHRAQLIDMEIPLGSTSDAVRVFEDADAAAEWTEADILGENASPDDVMEIAAYFRNLLGDRAAAEALAADLEARDYAADDVVVRDGDRGRDVYYVESGRIAIGIRDLRGRTVRLRVFTAGSLVGEISYYTGRPRSAGIVAVSAARLYRIPPEAIDALPLDAQVRFHAALARRVSIRLSDLDDALKVRLA